MEWPWISSVIMLPLATALLCGVVPARRAVVVGTIGAVLTVCSVAGLLWRLWHHGTIVEALGGWDAPLGIELYVDGFSGLMLAMTATVGIFVSLFSIGYFGSSPDGEERGSDHHEGFFWALWLVVWAALNGVFASADLFNMYVCIELMGLGSVALVALAGPMALRAAMRYLLVTLAGSLFYLLGVALLYGGWGTLDMQLLSGLMEASAASEVALAVMTLGLALKTALVPLHFWLPAAHANAPAPVSAVLSALVVKASFYMLARLWIDVFDVVDTDAMAVVLATLGAVAIFWGSIQALRQARLKLLVAYSTVAQIGYLFVAFAPATVDAATEAAWHGVVYFAIAHGCAKGAMFLAAGAIATALGGDRFSEMRGTGIELALPMFAFALAGLGLMGLPPSGGYTAKWYLLTAAARAEMPVVAAVVTIGGLLAALYVFKALYFAFARGSGDDGDDPTGGEPSLRPIPITMIIAALGLASVSVALGLWSAIPLETIDIGLPFDTAVEEGTAVD